MIFCKRQIPCGLTCTKYFVSKHTEIAKEKLRTDRLDAQIIYSFRLYCYGTRGMTREWLLHDNITSAESAVAKRLFQAI